VAEIRQSAVAADSVAFVDRDAAWTVDHNVVATCDGVGGRSI